MQAHTHPVYFIPNGFLASQLSLPGIIFFFFTPGNASPKVCGAFLTVA